MHAKAVKASLDRARIAPMRVPQRSTIRKIAHRLLGNCALSQQSE